MQDRVTIRFNSDTEPRVTKWINEIRSSGGNVSEEIKKLIRKESVGKELAERM